VLDCDAARAGAAALASFDLRLLLRAGALPLERVPLDCICSARALLGSFALPLADVAAIMEGGMIIYGSFTVLCLALVLV